MTRDANAISEMGVATAFELLLEEIEEVADELNRRGANAFERGQHNEVEALLGDARAYAAFQSRVRDLTRRVASAASRARSRTYARPGRARQVPDLAQGPRPSQSGVAHS